MKIAELRALKKQLQMPLPLLQQHDDWGADIDDGLDLNELIGVADKTHSYFIAPDETMSEEGISNGDTLLVSHQAVARHNQLVVANVDGQLMCRRLNLGFNQLTAEGLDPIELDEYASCFILGVVCNVIKAVSC